ncbi:MAG: DUF1761 domain-containing protein [Alphaproteobacteria bacterium]|nr:DUF1761 domain-containing protein [Alphaproteobacteria bacterium]
MSAEWDVNYVAVLVAAIAAMIIGAVYYLPAVAGKAWMNAIGKTEAEVRAAMTPRVLIAGFVLAILEMSVLAAIEGWAGAVGVADGVMVALIVWLGLTLPAASMNVLFEGRPTALHWVYGVNSLIIFAVAGAVIGWWRAM